MMLLRARTLAMGCSGARPGRGRGDRRAAERRAHPGGPRARVARSQRRPCAARALRAGADRRGVGDGSDGVGVPAAEALARGRASSRSSSAAKEGLALINGTDGMLGMLVLAIADLARLLRVADVGRRDVGRGAARDRPRVRRGSGRAAPAARPGGERREPARAAGRTRRSSPAIARATRACRTRTRFAARRRWRAPRATRLTTPRRVAEAELRSAIDNPMVLPDGRVESCGNFHGAPVGYACDFLAIAAADVGAIAERRTDRLLDATRSHGLPPFLAEDPGAGLGADARPLRAGGDRRREPPAGGAGERRLAADERDAGGPRVDGLGCRAQAAVGGRRARRGVGGRARVRRAGGSICARRCARRRRTAAALAVVRSRGRPGPDRFVAPDLEAAERRRPGSCSRRSGSPGRASLRADGDSGGRPQIRAIVRRCEPCPAVTTLALSGDVRAS